MDIARVAGWTCVVGKDQFKQGDRVVYIPIDAVLPPKLEGQLFPLDSKVKLEKSRIRTIKLRGAISQGLVVGVTELAELGYPYVDRADDGEDVAAELGIIKYEPPVKHTPGLLRGNMVSPKLGNPAFRKYTDIENFKYYPQLFEPGEQVVITEKLHGTSARYGWFPTHANTWWKKVKRFFGRLPAYEFCLGSRNVQLQDRKYDGFYNQNVYGKVAQTYNLEYRLLNGEAVYGEIVGPGIQKGYTYGCTEGDHEFYVYDVMVNGAWLSHEDLVVWCRWAGLKRCPELYVGPWDPAIADELRKGKSTLCDKETREGVVVKAAMERMSMIGRAVLKYLNDEYLLIKDQTDFH